MILEFLLGFIISTSVIAIFLSLNFNNSVNAWIIETSKFIYYTGHPLLDDDARYRIITKQFKNVFFSLSSVIFKILILLLFIAAVVALSSIIYSFIREENLAVIYSNSLFSSLFPPYLYHIPFIAGTFIPIVIFPIIFKQKKKDKSPYSSIERLLHYVFLGNANVAKFLFWIEIKKYNKELKSVQNTENVYISGLARAGTTVLMQYLGQLPQFSSLSYRFLPFLFMPRTWPKLTSKKKGKEKVKERYHKDGMMHSLDSYEALEEPFWRNYSGKDYIKADTLESYDLDKGVYQKYVLFRKLVARNKIYLAKNNNHLLRAESLHQLDRSYGNKTITIIPFREPYTQARSLLNQHRNLSQMQSDDEFFKDYMDFLVHHEFGLSHKVSVLRNSIENELPNNLNTTEYWLEVWFIFYSHAYSQFLEQDGFYFFCYEEFCENPYNSLVCLTSKINLQVNTVDSLKIINYENKGSNCVEEENKYSELYHKLKHKSINYTDG